ncbi:cold shock domain-containing protein [Thiomicrospira sp. R3]|uniref:cold shock domain-containing protein n=1 Tax=Thiomicrospira sp. R3 TaxID=3035472 RepID=UPI00259BE85D|nr:cold shock domain-containing protein [Thiomicrospira sp. R3]WFE69491.1 cold shock domain-containing protein [Thiomicrospira sp. R3]
MRGTIKFYSREKGFGFIYTDENDGDIYFRVQEWKEHSSPNSNDIVEFETKPGRKGPEAINIKCIRSASERKESEIQARREANDDRVTCPHCIKQIVPRVNFYNGKPQASYCPYCGGKVKDFGWCFIATAVYEDYNHPNVLVLRSFRDNQLKNSSLGRKFVALYYRKSPAVAKKLKNMPYVSAVIRTLLNSFVFVYNALIKNK